MGTRGVHSAELRKSGSNNRKNGSSRRKNGYSKHDGIFEVAIREWAGVMYHHVSVRAFLASWYGG